MSVRSAIGNSLVRVGKTFGGSVPPAIQASEAQQQMTVASPFSPGEPVSPYDGYSRQPRTRDFVPSYNVATRPRIHERVSFDTLKGLIDSYDVAQACVWHRIDSLRSVRHRYVPADGYNGDTEGAVKLATEVMRSPDRRRGFKSWFAAWMYDVLAYDAGALYRLRNRGGKVIGLLPVSGPTIAPLIDYWGNPPEPPAEAYVQYVNGVPWNWLTRDDLIYEPFRAVNDSIYGRAPIESIVLNANTDLRFQLHFLQRFCYDEQTEILTRSGWKRFPDVRGDEEFATRSAAGEFQWQKSKDGKLHVFDSGGTMVQFRNRYVDLLVTPNHRMLTRRKPQGERILKTARDREYDWHIRRADEFLGKCTVDWRLPLTSSWPAPSDVPQRFTLAAGTAEGWRGADRTTKVDMPMWAFARFLGIFIAEGHLRHDAPGKVQRYEIHVAQLPGGKLDEVRRILKDTGLSWSYRSDGRSGGFTVGCKALWTYLEQCGHGAPNKVLPAEVMDWPTGLLQDLMHGLMTGDGTVSASGQRIYITTSQRLADQVQEIWQKCGVYSSVITKAQHPTSFGKRTIYQVCARRETEFQVPKAQAVPYNGDVYCVSVPNGIVLVRRNGKTMWCGNTDGNIPEAFASAPESWSPEQIENWQNLWDSLMYGDQSQKHQIKWMPGGSTISWTNEKDFTDTFSLFLMRKTCAAFHLVPTDLGFTDNANYSTGESQADVVHRVGELPLMEYVEDILSRFLYDDLGLPLRFEFDRGEDQDDRATQAQADQLYINSAVVSADEIREMRFGLPVDEANRLPRIFLTERGGPIPLNAVLGVAGKNDPETGSPQHGEPLPHMVFPGTPGVMDAQVLQAPLAVDEYGPAALPPAPPQQPMPPEQAPVGKEAAPAAGDGGSGPSEGITSETGIYGDPLIRDEDEDDAPKVAKRHVTAGEARAAGREVRERELAAFRRFARARRRAGEWRDFRFEYHSPSEARELNRSGAVAVAKAAGEIAVAGLAVLAADTGRVLMLQRALNADDPAAGMWEFPGGHLEGDESPLAAAWREWQEECGTPCAPGVQTGTWTANGIYQGIVWTIESESMIPVRADGVITNPDDPDGDNAEAIAWWDPATLAGNPAVRPELLASLNDVLPLLLPGDGGDDCEPGDVAKAGDAAPKATDGSGQPPPVQSAWPGWDLDLQTAAYWAPLLAAVFAGALSAGTLVTGWLALSPASDAATKPDRIRELTARARDWLADRATGMAGAITDTVQGVLTDGYAIGAASATAATQASQAGMPPGSIAADMGEWKPGARAVARELAGNIGNGQGLADLLDQSGVQIKSIASTRLADLAKVLAEGAERGDSADDLTQAIEDMLSNPSRARMIVMTELARAANNAAAWQYRFHGVKLVQFVTAEDNRVCPECDAEEAAGPQPLSDVPQPPLHPLCRCALVPAGEAA